MPRQRQGRKTKRTSSRTRFFGEYLYMMERKRETERKGRKREKEALNERHVNRQTKQKHIETYR